MQREDINIFNRISPLPRGARLTAVQQIFEEIRGRIVDLTLRPGTVLSKNDIAEQFGVSQTPVREAFILLEEEGLVDVFPQSRTTVSYIDVQSAREAHVLRRSVEVEIARILCLDIDKEQIGGLRNIIAVQKAASQAEDFSAFTAADDQMHERLYVLAGIGGLWGLVHARKAHLDRLRRLNLPSKGKTKKILRDHNAIVDALAAHDADAAEHAIREHLKGTVSATEEIRSHFPEYFGQPQTHRPD